MYIYMSIYKFVYIYINIYIYKVHRKCKNVWDLGNSVSSALNLYGCKDFSFIIQKFLRFIGLYFSIYII